MRKLSKYQTSQIVHNENFLSKTKSSSN